MQINHENPINISKNGAESSSSVGGNSKYDKKDLKSDTQKKIKISSKTSPAPNQVKCKAE